MFNEFSEKFIAYYKTIDDVLFRFLKSVPEETTTILVSDHGFCPISKEVFLNNYLQDIGYLETVNGEVNLEKSMAVAYGYGDVWLNVKGREPHGIIEAGEYEKVREKLIESLLKVRINGERPIQKVVKREEVYWGPYLREAPDIIAVFNTGWQAARRPPILKQRINGHYVNEDTLWCGGHDGTHNPEDVPGILGFLGPDVVATSPLRASLWDLAPTILKVLNVPIPQDMDGKPLEIF